MTQTGGEWVRINGLRTLTRNIEIETADGSIAPLTAETDYSLYTVPARDLRFLPQLRRFIENLRKILDALFRLAGEKLRPAAAIFA